jgi:hypothetical protein
MHRRRSARSFGSQRRQVASAERRTTSYDYDEATSVSGGPRCGQAWALAQAPATLLLEQPLFKLVPVVAAFSY